MSATNHAEPLVAPLESLRTPWWVWLLGARRASLWGREPADLRAALTGCSGDLGAPAHRQSRCDHPSNKPCAASPDRVWQDAERDADGRMGRDEFLRLYGQALAEAHGPDADHAHERLLIPYRLPLQRHFWDEKQTTMHAWLGDILLDLTVVGVCVMLGDVIKYSFYSCDGHHGGHHGSHGHHYQGHHHGHHYHQSLHHSHRDIHHTILQGIR